MIRGEKTVIFGRHGESDDNGKPVYQREDAPLSELGREQAQILAQRVARLEVKPEVLIVSTLLRARQTAEPIASALGLEPIYSDLVVERIKPSSINGKPHTDIEAAATYRKWVESLYDPSIKVEDGENFSDTQARVLAQMEFLEQRPEETIMVVSHGVNIRNILAKTLLGESFSGETLRHFQSATETQNTGLTVLQHFAQESHWRMWTYNDHGHLDQ